MTPTYYSDLFDDRTERHGAAVESEADAVAAVRAMVLSWARPDTDQDHLCTAFEMGLMACAVAPEYTRALLQQLGEPTQHDREYIAKWASLFPVRIEATT